MWLRLLNRVELAGLDVPLDGCDDLLVGGVGVDPAQLNRCAALLNLKISST